MSIVNQYGNPISSSRFVKGANTGYNLPWQVPNIKDIDDLITATDWRKLVSASRSLYANQGIVRGAIDQKAMYTVGAAWMPQFTGQDKEWGKQAEEWLLKWYDRCDTKGGVYDFKANLYLDSISIDRDGDTFILFSETKTGYPQIQRIPAHQVGCVDKEEVVEEGRYRGLRIFNGVIVNRYGRPVAYRVLKGDRQYRDISARNMFSAFDPQWHCQHRGYPIFMHALNEFRSMEQSTEWELWAQLIVSSYAMIEHNETGDADMDSPDMAYGAAASDGSSQPGSRVMEGGRIQFFKAGDGSKIEQVKHDRPGPNYTAFHDRLIRTALAGVNWPVGLVWEAEKQGTANRAELAKADKAIQDRQSLLKPLARKQVQYAVSKAIERGDLEFNADWNKWDFTMPRKISIDLGRDSQARREDYSAGIKNLTDIVEEEGKTLDQHLRQRAYETARAEQIRLEVEAETGVAIDPAKMNSLDTGE